MKKKKAIKVVFWSIVVIIISNIPPIKTAVSFFLDNQHYRYSNYDGSFTFIEFKGHDTNMMYRRFADYKNGRQENPDTTLYRIFGKNPLAFWRWGEYFYDTRYKYPYKNWRKITEERGYDLKNSNNFQDF